MLSRESRLAASGLFSEAVRRGRRAGTRTLVVHLHQLESAERPRVGFVVSKAVGPAVTRNRVKRRLRHLSRERISSLPGSAVLVIRALPPAADASYAVLGADLDAAIGRALSRKEARPRTEVASGSAEPEAAGSRVEGVMP